VLNPIGTVPEQKKSTSRIILLLKAIFVYGGWEGHAPVRFRDLIVPWLESEGFDVTLSDSLDIYTDEALMAEVDLIVQLWTQGNIAREQLAPLLEAVEGCVGLAGWHGGLGDSFHDSHTCTWTRTIRYWRPPRSSATTGPNLVSPVYPCENAVASQ
jgi:type 1 glutamine amidotransferase